MTHLSVGKIYLKKKNLEFVLPLGLDFYTILVYEGFYLPYLLPLFVSKILNQSLFFSVYYDLEEVFFYSAETSHWLYDYF